LRRADTDRVATLDANAGDRAIFDDPHARHARALGQRLRDVGRIGLAIAWQEHSSHQV
jgi:hypothetical protein